MAELKFYRKNTRPQTGKQGGVYFIKDENKILVYNNEWEDYTNRATYDSSGKIIKDSYVKHKFIGKDLYDYIDWVCLLCRVDNTDIAATYYTYGTLWFNRANGLENHMHKIDFSIKKEYNKDQPVVYCPTITSDMEGIFDFVTCTYNGVKYAAIRKYNTNSNDNWGGWFDGESTNFDEIQIIEYNNWNTGTVLNEEIKNSIKTIDASQIKGNICIGKQYVSYEPSTEHVYEVITDYNISSKSVAHASYSDEVAWVEYDN